MRLDWMINDVTFYQTVLLEAAVRSGLYGELERGATPEHLMHMGYDPVILLAMLESLGECGWVEKKQDRWAWCGPVPSGRVLHWASHVRTWLGLAEHLHDPVPMDMRSWILESEQELLAESGADVAHLLEEVLGRNVHGRWLDVGSGPGTVARVLAVHADEVVMADLPEVAENWDQAMFPSQARFWAGNILESLPRGPFDGVTIIRFIENFNPEVVVDLLTRLAGELSSDGHMYLLGYCRSSTPWSGLFSLQVALHQECGQTYHVDDLRRLAEDAGLELEEVGGGALGYVVLKLGKVAPLSVGHEPYQRGHESQAPDPRSGE